MLWVFDTEDDSQGRVYWVDFFNGVEHQSFDNPDRAVEWLWNQEGEFWAVNLEYDLINLFGALLDKLTVLTYGGFGLLKASIYGRSVQFRNTLRHWPLSVEEMGDYLKFPKLPFDPTNLDYCKRDTEVTWFFISEMFTRYRELGIEEYKATLPSTSLAFFTGQWCKQNWERHPDMTVWEFLAQSRYGGRCEVFHTHPVRGRVYEYDINSSYPYVMKSVEFPILDTCQQNVTVLRLERGGVARCTVRTPTMELPLLPYKKPGESKLLFPVGEFTGTWTYPELRRAVELGYQIQKVHQCIEYQMGPSPFSAYMDFLYTKRQAVKGVDELMSYTLKILMNALFGKWGEEGELTVVSRGQRYTMRQIPRHSNMIWAAYVLAHGRLNLYRFMNQAAAVGRLLYVDTDSIFVKCASDVKPFPDSKQLGDLSFKGKHGYAHFKLPKLYQIDDTYKAKGIPKDKRHRFPEHLKKEFFHDGIAEFLRPYRWLESKKLREQPNVWHTVTKQIQAEYTKRTVRADGKTWPLKINTEFNLKNAYKPGSKPTLKRRLQPLR